MVESISKVTRLPERVVPQAMEGKLFTVVIPVFNSGGIVGTTIDRTVAVLRQLAIRFEVVCVNDGSQDDSWKVLEAKAGEYPEVVALDLLRNYGQHSAVLCGLRQAQGDWVVTIDDDLQNPPEEVIHLIRKADEEGYDAVFGRFRRKQASGTRRLGTRAIELINRRIFGQPSDLVVTNFRLLRRDVVDRICADNSATPYITGMALLYSRNPGNATVEHAPRAEGSSNYSALRIARLVVTILFSYSAFPLRLFAVLGFLVALHRIRDRRGLFGSRAHRPNPGRRMDEPHRPDRLSWRYDHRDGLHAGRISRPHPQPDQRSTAIPREPRSRFR